jgi:hypothetical protein
MWAGHFLFHLSTGWGSAWEVVQRNAYTQEREAVLPLLGVDAMHVLQTVVLDAGLLLALYLMWRVALTYASRGRDALRLIAPWATISVGLYAFGIWIFLQPMQMRGLAGAMSRL